MHAYFNRFVLDLTKAQALSASHQGSCDEDVAKLVSLPAIARQLRKVPDEALISELSEYGAWDEIELQDRVENERRIVWITACDIKDEVCYGRKDDVNCFV